MTSSTPRIGMDRYVDPAWMSMAAEIVRGDIERADLDARLAMDISASEVRIKTIGILGRIWFPKEKERISLVEAAADHAASDTHASKPVAFTAVAIAAYPFFGQVVETVGRLINIQGSCTPGEVHRRMFERHGKRSTISQADSYAFKTMVAWGMIERAANMRIVPKAPLLAGTAGKSLLDKGANLFRGSITPLSSGDPLLFAFR